ncbi:MAG: hypothetical protein ACHQ5A_06045 [Opitutales bacterium]
MKTNLLPGLQPPHPGAVPPSLRLENDPRQRFLPRKIMPDIRRHVSASVSLQRVRGRSH